MRPIDDMLVSAQGKTRFHMPGHKGRLESVPAALDMTELASTDDLYAPQAGIAEAERLLARSAGAGASILVPGGSTAGILAMVLAYVRPGGRLLMRRDAHHSAQSACILADVEPVLLPPGADLCKAARDIPCDAVFVTRPTFHGLVEPLPRADVPVLVDAAHGAHFSWWDRPESALRAGADCAVESAHKTLGAYTGGAWLHLRRAEDEPRLRRMLRMVSTSSPSFLILRSLDEARAFMDEHGREALARLTNWCEDARGKLAAMGFPCPSLGDPTRLYIRTDGMGLTGWEALLSSPNWAWTWKWATRAAWWPSAPSTTARRTTRRWSTPLPACAPAPARRSFPNRPTAYAPCGRARRRWARRASCRLKRRRARSRRARWGPIPPAAPPPPPANG